MNVLYLTLKKEWFFKILSGEKKEEYREEKEYWNKRLNKKYDVIIFRLGYKKNASELIVECLGIEKRLDIETPLGKGNFYVLKLGKIIEQKNL